MFERIIVGVANAPSAKEAVRSAVDVAAKFGAELHLVMAFSGSGTSPTGRDREHAEGLLESLALASSVPTETHALPGDPSSAILRVAEQVDADLIVVGNRGMKGAARILGSVPNNVAHRAQCAVLIVATT